jgi:phospholipid/cholesterol/gamma-HCH transport system substrate-binding protein
VNKRIAINMAVFALIGVLLAFWAVTNVVSFDFIDRPYTVTAQFATSPGLSSNFEVTDLGQKIGSIEGVTLVDKAVSVKMKINRDIEVPRAVDAAVRRKSAVGEPYVDLSPTAGTNPNEGPRLAGGDNIPIERTSTPLAYSDLFKAVNDLVAAADPGDLHTLVHELAVGVDGRADSFRETVAGLDQITGDLAKNADLLDGVFTDLTRLTNTFANHSDAIGASFDNLAALSASLAQSTDDVNALLRDAPTLGNLVQEVLAKSKGDLGCTLDALGTVGTKLDADTIDALSHVIELSPKFLFVLQGLVTDNGIHGRLLFNAGPTGPLVYAQPLTPPTVPDVPVCSGAASVGIGAAPSGVAGQATPVAGAPATSTPQVPKPNGPATVAAPPESSTKPLSGGLDLGPWLQGLGLLAVLAVVVLVARRLWPNIGAGRRTGQDGGDGP